MNCDETWPNYRGSDKEGVRTLIEYMDFSDDVKYGKTKIFIRKSPDRIRIGAREGNEAPINGNLPATGKLVSSSFC